MNRTILAFIAIAASVTLAVPAAQACISCEYKPEVLESSAAPAKVKKRVRVDAVIKSRKSRASKDVAERKPAAKRPTHTAKAPAGKPAVEDKATTAAAPSGTENGRAQSVYNTLIKTAKPADSNPAATDAPSPTVEKPAVESPTKPVATAATAAATADAVKDDEANAASTSASESENVNVSEEKGDKSTGCKKFFPMAGLTLTVECK